MQTGTAYRRTSLLHLKEILLVEVNITKNTELNVSLLDFEENVFVPISQVATD